MKKYLYIYKSELMSTIQYVFNILSGFISYFIMIFIFVNLWNYLYDSPSELINGYNKSQMIWYVIITELLWMSLNGKRLCDNISKDIKSGNIAYKINKPYNYIGYVVMNHLGSISIQFVLYLIFGIGLGIIFLGNIPSLSILNILCLLLVFILAITINILFTSFVGLFSFYIEDSSPFHWVYTKFLLILGTLFPIEFFPKFLQPILRFSPIYVINYGPAKLFVSFDYSMFLSIIVSQIIYIFVGIFICSLVYRRGVKKLNVNGG